MDKTYGIANVLERVIKERAEIQMKLRIAELGGPVNADTRNWLAGQNRAYGLVIFWLRDELRTEENNGGPEGLPAEI